MAIQRVPGQMLEANLTRSSDLAFQTDLLYLDVSNNRVGIKTDAPGNFALDVNGTARFQDNVTISGNLTVTGETTVVNTTNMEIEDNILVLNSGGSTGNDAGLMINRGGVGDNAVFYWDEVDDKFKFVITPSDGSTVTSINDSTLARIAVATPVDSDDAVTKDYVDTAVSGLNNSFNIADDGSTTSNVLLNDTLQFLGGNNIATTVSGNTVTFTGAKDINVNSITSDDSTAIQINDGLNVAGNIDVQGNTVTGLGTPSADSDAATKAYVDTRISATNSLTVGGDDSSEITLDLDTSLNVKGGNNISTSVAGDTLTITGATDLTVNSLESADSTAIQINDGLNVAGATTVNNTLNVTGAATLGTSLTLPTGATVTAILDEDTMSSNSDTALATQQSIKAYVDAQIVATNTLNISDDTSTEVSLDLDNTLQILGGNNISTTVSGDNKLTIAGAKDINVNSITSDDSTAIQINDGLNVAGTIDMQGNGIVGVVDPSNPQDVATKAYVDAQNQSQALTFVGDDSTGTAVNSGETFKIAGTQNITTAVSGDTLTITGPDLSSYATQSYVTSQGYITNSTTTIVGDDSTGTTLNSGETFKIAGGNNITTSVDNDVLSIQGATDINVNSISSDDSTAIQINDGLNVAGNIDVQGNTVTGLATPSADSDAATKAYVDTQVSASNSLTIGGDDSSEITLDLDTTLNTVGTGGIATTVAGDTLTINLTNTGVVASTYGSSTEIPQITVDAQGRVTNIGTNTISTTLTVSDDTSTEASIALGTDSLQILGGNNISTQISGSTITLVGATDINVNSITSTDSSAIQVNDHLNVAGNINIVGTITATGDGTFEDVRVRGNLTVDGTQTILNTETLSIEDNIIVLNRNVSGTPAADAGIEINRGDEASKSLLWNESTDKWTVGSDTFVAGTFEGNLTGNVTGNADTATSMANVITIVGDDSTGTTLNSQETFKIAGGNNITTSVDNDVLSIQGSTDINVNSITSDDSTAIQINDGLNVAGTIDMQGNTVTGLATPSADSDAATKAYVDTQVSANNSLTLGADDSSEITLNLDTTLNIKGGTGITTSVTGDTLTITGVNQASGISFGDNTSSTISIPDGGTLNLVGSGGITATVLGDTLTIDGSAVAADLGTFTFSGNKLTQTASDGDFEMDMSGSGKFVMSGTSALVIPSGTVAERPYAPTVGSIRYNTDIGRYEVTQNGLWVELNAGVRSITDNVASKVIEYNKLTASSTVIDEWDHDEYAGAFYHVSIEDISNNIVGQLNINVVHGDDNDVYHTVYDKNEDSTNLVTWSTTHENKRVKLIAQANAESSHINLKIHRISLFWFENTHNFTNTRTSKIFNVDTEEKVIDRLTPISTHSGAKYYAVFAGLIPGNYDLQELLVTHDESNAYITSYGSVSTSVSPLVSYTATMVNGVVNVSATSNGVTGNVTLYRIDLGLAARPGTFNNITYRLLGNVDTTASTTIDSFEIGSRKTAKYIVSLFNVESKQSQVSEISLIHNGSTSSFTETSIDSGTTIGNFSTDISGSKVRLRFQGSGYNDTRVSFARFDYETPLLYRANADTTGSIYASGSGALHLPSGTTAQRPSATLGAIRFNTTNNQYEVCTDGSSWQSLRTQAYTRTVTKDVFAGDGSTQTFTSANVATDAENLLVYIDGVIQEPDINYTINIPASTITITDEAPHSGARVVVIRGFADDVGN
jgi:hypothetical protein